MRIAEILFQDKIAGILTENDEGYQFQYKKVH